MAVLGLTAEDGLTQVWFADENGRLAGGAEAVNEALKQVWWARPWTLFYRVPGLKQLEDWSYRWLADNRYRLPGSTAQCSVGSKQEAVGSKQEAVNTRYK